MSASLEKGIEAEITCIERRTRMTWFLGLPAVVAVAGLVGWEACQFKRVVLNPQNLATVAAVELDARLPGLLRTVEGQLVAEAPRVADEVSIRFAELLPVIRDSGKESVDLVASQVPLLGESAESAIRAYFSRHSADVQRLVAKHGTEGFAPAFVKTVVEDVVRSNAFDEGVSVGEAHEKAFAYMRQVRHHLDTLAAKNPFHMTHAERLERRFIAAWVGMFLRSFGMKVKDTDGRGELSEQIALNR